MKNEKYYLNCRYDTADSFYQKAMIEEKGSIYNLYSYNSLVCIIDNGIAQLIDIDIHSNTTRRHVREFIKQYAYDELNRVNDIYSKNKVSRY